MIIRYWGRILITEACSKLVYIHSVLTWAGFGPHQCAFLLVHKKIKDKGIEEVTEVHTNHTH